MALIQISTTGQMLLTKVVVDDGLSVCTLLTYRFFMGAILVIPLAVIFEKLALQSPRICPVYCYFNVVNHLIRSIKQKNIAYNCTFFLIRKLQNPRASFQYNQSLQLIPLLSTKRRYNCSYLYCFDLDMLC